ncbi:MAG: hypothetical protein CMJ85_05860 [Planctomycetes bacterium]|jgi:8-oxo-dGTP pyrophosphatase MutT (NUDIX family)|nr:hypothetical protein [Planctomycetota bacterium]
MLMSDDDLRAELDPPASIWRSLGGHRDAAVVVPLVRRTGVDHLLYVVRCDDLPHHAGEVAFPGGSREGNETVEECALRELAEETGIQAQAVEILGSLPERTSGVGFRVHAMVARIDPPAHFTLDEVEIQSVVEVSVRDLADDDQWQLRDVQGRTKVHRGVPFFPIGDRWLWGLTARFTQDLLARR